MSTVVFLGPSLDAASAARYCDATILPPAKMGDVLKVAKTRPNVIAIIDGYFELTPAVWHKEILYAIANGIWVVGGASMGALRAAELHAFGMIGVGKIFEGFASGRFQDDDEVAVSHADKESQFVCLSEAMVNIRFALREALANDVLDQATHDRLIASVKALYYPHRSWTALFEAAGNAGLDDAGLRKIIDFIEAGDFNQKRDDAVDTLRMARKLAEQGTAPPPPSFELQYSKYWVQAEAEAVSAQSPAQQHVSSKQILNHVMAFDERWRALRERALLVQLVQSEARRLNLPGQDNAKAMESFRRRRGLLTAEMLARWIADNGLSREECLRIAHREAMVDAVWQRHARRLESEYLSALQADGKYGDVAERVARKWDKVDQRELRTILFNNTAIVEQALARYERQFGKIGSSVEQFAAQLGFEDSREFLLEVVAEFMP